MMLTSPNTHNVIPAQAGIHAEGLFSAPCKWIAHSMDSGLRRNDPVVGTYRVIAS